MLRYISSLVECNTEVCYELGVELNVCAFSLHGSYYICALVDQFFKHCVLSLTSDMCIFATCTHYNVCMLFLYNFTYVRVFATFFNILSSSTCVWHMSTTGVPWLSVAIGKQLSSALSLQPTVH